MTVLSGTKIVEDLPSFCASMQRFQRRLWSLTLLIALAGMTVAWFGYADRLNLWCTLARMVGTLIAVLSPYFAARLAGTLPVRAPGSPIEIKSIGAKGIP